MINRVASSAGSRTMLNTLQWSSRNLLRAQTEATTGRRIMKMSDAPADGVGAMNQRANIRRLEQFSRNATEAQSWLDTADGALSDVSDRLSSVRSLLVQANSPSADSTSRNAIAGEIRAIRATILQSANTSRNGRPLFAGNAGGAQAYDSSGNYLGDAGTVNLPVGTGVTLQVNRTGPDVFGTADPGNPLNGDLFQLLDSLANSVAAGDSSAIGAGITLVDSATRRVNDAQVVVGSRAKQLEDLVATLEDSKVAAKEALSRLENVDTIEAIVNLKTKEAAYQAAVQVTAKVIQPTLLDFLR